MFGFVRFVATNLSIKRNDAGETSPWVSSVSEAHPANPLVSVVIPAFNRERVIGKAIKSVLAHWLRRFRILKSLLLTMGLATKRLRMRSSLLAPSLVSALFGSKQTKVRKRPETRERGPHGVNGCHSWTLTTNGCREA